MYPVNQKILAIYDTKNDVCKSYTLSLENVRSYTITFHVVDVTEASIPPDVVDYTLYAVLPEIPWVSDTGITPEVELSSISGPTGFAQPALVASSVALDAVASELISDADFGYKQIKMGLSCASPTTDQMLVVAVLHTTTLK